MYVTRLGTWVFYHIFVFDESLFCSFTFFVTHFEKLTFVSFEGIFKTFSSYFAEKIPFLDTLISWSLFMTFSELNRNSIDISSCILILSIRTEFSSSLTRHYYRIFWHNLFYRWFTRHFRICDRFIFIFHRFLNRFSDNVTLVFRIEVLSWKKVDQVI